MHDTLKRVMEIARGSGGVAAILAGQPDNNYAGLRLPGKSLLEAALTFFAQGDYEEIFVFTSPPPGGDAGCHLPEGLDIEGLPNLQTHPAGWYFRCKDATPPPEPKEESPNPNPGFPSREGRRKHRKKATYARTPIQPTNALYQDRFEELLKRVYEFLGIDRSSGTAIEGTAPRRVLVLIDAFFMLPYLSGNRGSGYEAEPVVREHAQVFSRIPDFCRRQSRADILIFCSDGSAAQRLRDGTFSTMKECASAFPKLQWPEAPVLAWPQAAIGPLFDGFLGDAPLPAQTSPYEILKKRPVAKQAQRDPLQELRELIGMDEITRQVEDILAVVRQQDALRKLGLDSKPLRLHAAFMGPAGTGKTTVAKILGRLFARLGVLGGNAFVYAKRGDLIAGFVGQTAPKTREVCQRAVGGILMIDEAYDLVHETQDTFGDECVAELLTWMDGDDKRLAVFLAGYRSPMERLLQTNQGLNSRVAFRLNFRDYTLDELVRICHKVARDNSSSIEPGADEIIRNKLKAFIASCKSNHSDFGNGRDVANLVQNALLARARRLIDTTPIEANKALFTVLTREDFANAPVRSDGMDRVGSV